MMDDVAKRRMQTRSLIPSRLKALDDNSIRYELLNDGHYLVAGKIDFYPVTGFWRSRETSAHGYVIEALMKECHAKAEVGADASTFATLQGMETSAGRLDAGRTASATSEIMDATSEGGEQPCPLSPSAALLPEVLP